MLCWFTSLPQKTPANCSLQFSWSIYVQKTAEFGRSGLYSRQWGPLAFIGLSPLSLIPYFTRVLKPHRPCKTGSLNASQPERGKGGAPQGRMRGVANTSLGTNVCPETYTCSFLRLKRQVARQVREGICTSNKLQGDSEPKWGTYVKDKTKPLELSGVLHHKHQIYVIRQVYRSI